MYKCKNILTLNLLIYFFKLSNNTVKCTVLVQYFLNYKIIATHEKVASIKIVNNLFYKIDLGNCAISIIVHMKAKILLYSYKYLNSTEQQYK